MEEKWAQIMPKSKVAALSCFPPYNK